jgi:ABC-type nitrate/sulfonate/bicarbonate transport system permease component
MNTMSIQTTPPPSLIPLLFLSLPLGPTKIEKTSSFSAAVIFPLLNTIFQQKTSGKWEEAQTVTKNYK